MDSGGRLHPSRPTNLSPPGEGCPCAKAKPPDVPLVLPPNHLAPKTHPCENWVCAGGLLWESQLSRVPPYFQAAPRATILRGQGRGLSLCSRTSLCSPPSEVRFLLPWQILSVDARFPGLWDGAGAVGGEAETPGYSLGWCNFLIWEMTFLCLLESGIQWKV